MASPSSSSSPAGISSHLSPGAYMARVGGGPTSAEDEIRDSAHRLYVYMACDWTDKLQRLSFFRRLVQLCIRNPGILLQDVVSSPSLAALEALEACTTCRNQHANAPWSLAQGPNTGCCWFRPGERAQVFLGELLSLCDNHAALFSEEVSLEQLSELFDFIE